jgi:uncharacterized protein (DUF885 family)
MTLSSARGCSASFSGAAAALTVLLVVTFWPSPNATAARNTLPQAPASSPAAKSTQPPAPTDDRDRALLAILDEHVDFLHRTSPLAASARGDERYNDQLPDLSAAAIAARRAELADRLRRLQALERERFSEQDHTDADLLIYDLTETLEAARFSPEHIPISTMGGPQLDLPQMADRLPFRTPKHYADYATRLEKVPAAIDNIIDNMRAGLGAGRVPPRVTVAEAVSQARQHGAPDIEANPTESPFYKPFLGRPADDEQAARARRAVAERIAPAYRKLADFLESEYLPRTRETVGASEGLDGRPAYDFAIRHHTTLDYTADEVHQIGLKEVARIRREMDQAIDRSDFAQKDSLKGDDRFAAFTLHLRTDPRFYYTDEQALLDAYTLICKRIDPELPRLFRTLPRNTYGVRPLPTFAARTAPTGYYYPGSAKGGIPGYFMVNTYRLDQRPKYSMLALTIHEAVPGHHFQYSLAEELEGLHEYRTWTGFTAFGEGWALYAERLGLEMGDASARGFYADPYDDFGRLSFEMWRACRLVVDTGIHAFGWSRQRAVDYMLVNTALAQYDIEREVDRYISWPGQATGYKIGELKIRELRALSETKLGDRFSLRRFHDAVLGAGQLPLPVLQGRIFRWIDSELASDPDLAQ